MSNTLNQLKNTVLGESLPMDQKKREIERISKLIKGSKPLTEFERLRSLKNDDSNRINLFTNPYINGLPTKYAKFKTIYEQLKFLNNSRNIIAQPFVLELNLESERYFTYQMNEFIIRFTSKHTGTDIIKKTISDEKLLYGAVKEEELREFLNHFEKIKTSITNTEEEPEENEVDKKIKSFLQNQIEADIYFEKLKKRRHFVEEYIPEKESKIEQEELKILK